MSRPILLAVFLSLLLVGIFAVVPFGGGLPVRNSASLPAVVEPAAGLEVVIRPVCKAAIEERVPDEVASWLKNVAPEATGESDAPAVVSLSTSAEAPEIQEGTTVQEVLAAAANGCTPCDPCNPCRPCFDPCAVCCGGGGTGGNSDYNPSLGGRFPGDMSPYFGQSSPVSRAYPGLTPNPYWGGGDGGGSPSYNGGGSGGSGGIENGGGGGGGDNGGGGGDNPIHPVPEPGSMVVWILISLTWAGSAWMYQYWRRWGLWAREDLLVPVPVESQP